MARGLVTRSSRAAGRNADLSAARQAFLPIAGGTGDSTGGDQLSPDGEQTTRHAQRIHRRPAAAGADWDQRFVSRPGRVTDPYESRRHVAPRLHTDKGQIYAQTELYESHWAHLMQGKSIRPLGPGRRSPACERPSPTRDCRRRSKTAAITYHRRLTPPTAKGLMAPPGRRSSTGLTLNRCSPRSNASSSRGHRQGPLPPIGNCH